MNADEPIDGIVIVEKTLEIGSNRQSNDNIELIVSVAFGVVGGIIVFLILICLCKRCSRRQKLQKGLVTISNSTLSTSDDYRVPIEGPLKTTEDVTKRYERSISTISTKSQIYLVPFEVLPSNFDYSSREIEVRADYVILKDLKLLEKYPSTSDEDKISGNLANGGIVNEAYDQQESYNPYVSFTIPPLEREPYKKQPSYNPTFY